MSEGIGFDFSELSQLTADLGDAPKTAGKKIRQAFEVSSRHVKDKWAKKLEGTEGVPHGPKSITYDIEATPGDQLSTIRAEIGSETGRLQAPIVTVIEFGSPNLPPRGYGLAALQETEADFEKGLGLAIDLL